MGYISGLQTILPLTSWKPLRQSVESPSSTVVSRSERFPLTCGPVGESAQATVVTRATALRTDRTRDLIDIEGSVWVMRCIYPALR